ncbi:MAG: small subunit ribosomal protein S9 [archaeon GW2011_AR17]|nr:MAG: small subunit ribosomal protein S9 [archaeon GW2011_AR17]
MKVVQVSGKRKRAVARARLKEGKGIIRFNALQLDGVSPELARLMIMEPLILAGDLAKSVDIDVRVQGGQILEEQNIQNRMTLSLVLNVRNRIVKGEQKNDYTYSMSLLWEANSATLGRIQEKNSTRRKCEKSHG